MDQIIDGAESAQKDDRTLGQAARIPGVTPAAVSALMVYLRSSRGAAEARKMTREQENKEFPGPGSGGDS